MPTSELPEMVVSAVWCTAVRFFSSFCSAERNTLCHGKVTCKTPILLSTICCHAEGTKVHKIIWLDIIVPAICSSCTYREVNQRCPSVIPSNFPPWAVQHSSSCKIGILQGIIFPWSIPPLPGVCYWPLTWQSTSLDSCLLSRTTKNRQNLKQMQQERDMKILK